MIRQHGIEQGGNCRIVKPGGDPVITSYSIHYTKLYEVIHLRFEEVVRPGDFLVVDGDVLLRVITSYSIHYTKLYEAGCGF